MDEIEQYRDQLASVRDGLKENPSDETLLNLEKELSELLDLLQAQDGNLPSSENSETVINESSVDSPSHQSPQPSAAPPPHPHPSTSRLRFNVGDTVLAQWRDKRYYQAKITQITGSTLNPRYTVNFVKFSEVETLSQDNVRAFKGPPRAPAPSSRTPMPPSAPKTSESKISKNQNKVPSSQQKWQQFTQKAGKNKHLKSKIGNSIFRSPDDPNSRVGVARKR
uniref:ARAD1C29348p n=1 Tax=Blastobotrys adeninivorans TaxID=409370 RepID=A0A060T336_BLAAD